MFRNKALLKLLASHLNLVDRTPVALYSMQVHTYTDALVANVRRRFHHHLWIRCIKRHTITDTEHVKKYVISKPATCPLVVEHDWLSAPKCPIKHVQLYEPIVFTHFWSFWQWCPFVPPSIKHSSTSRIGKNSVLPHLS